MYNINLDNYQLEVICVPEIKILEQETEYSTYIEVNVKGEFELSKLKDDLEKFIGKSKVIHIDTNNMEIVDGNSCFLTIYVWKQSIDDLIDAFMIFKITYEYIDIASSVIEIGNVKNESCLRINTDDLSVYSIDGKDSIIEMINNHVSDDLEKLYTFFNREYSKEKLLKEIDDYLELK